MDVAWPAAEQKTNPFRLPDWRWRRAVACAAPGRRCSPTKDDAETVTLAKFARAEADARTAAARARLAAAWPGLPAAMALWAGDTLRRAEVEARLLAGQADADVAARTGLSAEAVGWYEAAYFEVRAHLNARDWVVTRAIGARAILDRDDPSALLKTVGYHAGPVLLDFVLAVVTGGPLPAAGLPAVPAARQYVQARRRVQIRQFIDGLRAVTPGDWAVINQAARAAYAVDQAQTLVPPVLAKPDPVSAAEAKPRGHCGPTKKTPPPVKTPGAAPTPAYRPAARHFSFT